MWAMKKLLHMICALVIVGICITTTTHAWQSLGQDALNESIDEPKDTYPVELIKLERQESSEAAAKPIPGTVFYLFTENGEKLNGRYVTDEDGKIRVDLVPGNYYFKEVNPAPGYTYDRVEEQVVRRYPFTIEAGATEAVLVIAYNLPIKGNLTLEKLVENGDGSKLTSEQKQEVFEFTVTFSDGGTRRYRIDDGEEQVLTSGGKLYLKHGQQAVFTDIPGGVLYHITETPKEGYDVLGSGHQGNISATGAHAVFLNIYEPEEPEEPGILKVTKVLAGNYPDTEKEKEFSFTLIIDGVEKKFTLKPGETTQFEIPAGSGYEVKEENYYPNGYIQSIINGIGASIGGQTVETVVTNTYVKQPDIEIPGEKKWVLNGADESVIPESITVRLKQGETIVDEKVVTRDKNGKWLYTFSVPQHDDKGQEIQYTIEEVPIKNFKTTYNGYDITNTYIKPVEAVLPSIEKVIQGEGAPSKEFTFALTGKDNAPMPEGAVGNTALVYITGEGIIDIGKITFEKAGTYVYELTELDPDEQGWQGWEGWETDKSVYTLTYVVTEETGGCKAVGSLTKDGQTVDKILFENTYVKKPETEDKVIIAGEKKWHHISNPQENWPESVTLYIYGDGKQVSTLTVTKAENWKYSIELPKYTESGQAIVYTIMEEPVPGYKTEIQGYNVVNTYQPEVKEDEVIVSGQKRWNHGENPEIYWPRTITLYLYADGELIRQEVITKKTEWSYTYVLPRYGDDGHAIVYTVDEKPVAGYEKVIHGYDIINTYKSYQEEEQGGGGITGDGDIGTGDKTNLVLYLALMIVSFILLILLMAIFAMENKQKREGHEHEDEEGLCRKEK